MQAVLNFSGIFFILFLAWLMSYDRRNINYKIIGRNICIQFIWTLILVKFPAGIWAIETLGKALNKIVEFSFEGLGFVFGSLAQPTAPTGFIFAIQAIGSIIFTGCLISILNYYYILPFVISKIGRLVGTISGCAQLEGFVCTANMFLGGVEAPLTINRYLNVLTRSEMMVMLVANLGSMAINVLAGYAVLGIPPNLLVMSCALIPFTSIIFGKILLPETETPQYVETVDMEIKRENSLLEAIISGAMQGLNLILTICASIVAMISLVAMLNGILGCVDLSLNKIFSFIFQPIAYFLAIDPKYIPLVGNLLGTKLSLNECVAFVILGKEIAAMDPRTASIMAIMVSGFANFGTMAISLSGISALCPEKKSLLASLIFRANMGGFLLSIFNAMIVGLIMLF